MCVCAQGPWLLALCVPVPCRAHAHSLTFHCAVEAASRASNSLSCASQDCCVIPPGRGGRQGDREGQAGREQVSAAECVVVGVVVVGVVVGVGCARTTGTASDAPASACPRLSDLGSCPSQRCGSAG